MTKKNNEAYRRAEEEIEAALREQATELNLSGDFNEAKSKLTELPESIGKLKRLRSLNLSGNQFTKLPESLGQLMALQSLNLSYNGLTELPEWLGQCKQLQVLNLSDNFLTTLPDSLGKLTKLDSLFLNNNQFTGLPESLSQCKSLKRLHLYANQLTMLPDSFSKLTALETLSIAANPIQSLAGDFGDLSRLRSLSLAGTKIRVLPETIASLAELRFLALGQTPLRQIPNWIGKLKSLEGLELLNDGIVVCVWEKYQRVWLSNPERAKRFRGQDRLPESFLALSNLRELYLHGNDKLGIPPEILGPGWNNRETKSLEPHLILSFYFGKLNQSAKPLNEVKLLLVGHGRVGKTSLSKALRGVAHDQREPETPGIERHPLPLLVSRSNITAHIWDFGGQEFLHQTHQFFFSERSIYLVVLTGRQGRPMQEAEYWLRLIRTYGTGSPVVIALNQIKVHPFTVDEHFLRESYPEVKVVIKTDCDPRVGIEPLRKLLGKLAGGMPSVREKIDPAWARVRARLEDMRESFVTFDHYREICSQEGVKTSETQETLATILDCLGIALNYREDPRLRETSVLKPRWLVDGIYTILRWLHKHETNGEMRLEDFPKALRSRKTYPPEMHKFLLALMEKFELCFPVDTEEGVYLVPGLLEANQPLELKKFLTEKSRRLQFRYDDVRPPGLLPRFIVRSHTLSERQPRWLRGVVLKRGTARALVRGDHEGRITDVFALGDDNDRVWLTEFILSEMRVLNDKLPVRTFVESEGQPGVWTELEILREDAVRADPTRTERGSDGRTVLVNARETLRQVESVDSSTLSYDPLPLFICYAHANERIVKQLIPSLKVLARRGYIAAWRDTDLIPGDDWDDTIKDRLSGARIILFMISRAFLASSYITDFERPLAMAMAKQKKAVVVPILLSACSWEDEDFAKLEKLPRKDELVSSFTPRENAWALVEEGLKRTVNDLRTRTFVPGALPFRISKHS